MLVRYFGPRETQETQMEMKVVAVVVGQVVMAVSSLDVLLKSKALWQKQGIHDLWTLTHLFVIVISFVWVNDLVVVAVVVGALSPVTTLT